MPQSMPVVTALPYVGRAVNQSARSAWIRCPATAARVTALLVTRPLVAENPQFQASLRLLGSRDQGQTQFVLGASGKGTGFAGAQPPQTLDGQIGVTNPNVRTMWDLALIPDRLNPLGEPVPDWGDGVSVGPQIIDTSNLWVAVEATCHDGFVGESFYSAVLFATDLQGDALVFDVESWRS